VSGQHHAPAALSTGKESPVPIGEEAGWAPEPVWTTWRSENSCLHRDSNSDPYVVQPVASRYTDWATPAPLLFTLVILIDTLYFISFKWKFNVNICLHLILCVCTRSAASLQLNKYETELFNSYWKIPGYENWRLEMIKLGLRIWYADMVWSTRIMTSRILTTQIHVSCLLFIVRIFVLLRSLNFKPLFLCDVPLYFLFLFLPRYLRWGFVKILTAKLKTYLFSLPLLVSKWLCVDASRRNSLWSAVCVVWRSVGDASSRLKWNEELG
jgi:hypothetical protein